MEPLTHGGRGFHIQWEGYQFIPWIGGSIYLGKGSIYHRQGVRYTMGRGFDIPWIGVRYTMSRRIWNIETPTHGISNA
jgi:hypothetical protein